MNPRIDQLRRLVPGLWAGVLLGVALLAAPSAFGTLPRPDAGLVVARLFAGEAQLSLVLALFLVILERRAGAGRPALSVGVLCAAGAMFCTVAGYYGLQPMMAAARAGDGSLSFGQLHAVSLAFFAVKTGAVLTLAWRGVAPR